MKKILLGALWFVLSLGSFPALAKEITFVDIAGRTVTLSETAKKVVLGEGRMIYGIAPLFGRYGNMFNYIVGMKGDLRLYDPDTYYKYLQVFPQLADIPELGRPYRDDLDVDDALKIDTDVVLMNLGNYFQAVKHGTIERFERAGIKVVFIDFRQAPARNTIPSMLILGKVFGKEKESAEVVDFYINQVQKVYLKVANKKDDERPLVFIERSAASGFHGCCMTFGDHNMGRFVSMAGGRNLGTKLFGVFSEMVSPEYVFKEDPDVIIGTGANWLAAKPTTGAVLLGYDADSDEVDRRLANLANREGWDGLKAVKNKRFYSIYHQFYNSPYNFVAVQYFAKAFYPDDFRDLDPSETFRDFHIKFLPINYSGQFWVQYK